MKIVFARDSSMKIGTVPTHTWREKKRKKNLRSTSMEIRIVPKKIKLFTGMSQIPPLKSLHCDDEPASVGKNGNEL